MSAKMLNNKELGKYSVQLKMFWIISVIICIFAVGLAVNDYISFAKHIIYDDKVDAEIVELASGNEESKVVSIAKVIYQYNGVEYSAWVAYDDTMYVEKIIKIFVDSEDPSDICKVVGLKYILCGFIWIVLFGLPVIVIMGIVTGKIEADVIDSKETCAGAETMTIYERVHGKKM